MKFEGCFFLESNTGRNNEFNLSSSVESSVSESALLRDVSAGAGAEECCVSGESVSPIESDKTTSTYNVSTRVLSKK